MRDVRTQLLLDKLTVLRDEVPSPADFENVRSALAHIEKWCTRVRNRATTLLAALEEESAKADLPERVWADLEEEAASEGTCEMCREPIPLGHPGQVCQSCWTDLIRD